MNNFIANPQKAALPNGETGSFPKKATCEFLVKGSAPEPYKVTFIKHGSTVDAICTCPAGHNELCCKHRFSIFAGLTKGIVSPNVSEVETVLSWIRGTDIEAAVEQVRRAQLEEERIENQLAEVARVLPITLRLADGGLGVVLKTNGSFTGSELVDAHMTFVQSYESAIKTLRYWYSDFTGGASVNLKTVDLMVLGGMATLVAKENPNLAVALCSPRDLQFGLARMGASFASGSGLRVRAFRHPGEAKAWLREIVKENITFA